MPFSKLQRKLYRRGLVCIGVYTRRGSVFGVYRRQPVSAQPLSKQEATGSIPVGSIVYPQKSALIAKSSVAGSRACSVGMRG